MGVMLNNFEQGLGKETNAAARVKMYPTYVRSVPDGTGRLTVMIRKFSDRQALANSADPDQTALQSDQGLHCLPFHLDLLDTISLWKDLFV